MAIKNFYFFDDANPGIDQNGLIGRVAKGVISVKQLLEIIDVQLNFRSYFGFNWNALYDCLRDFGWTDKRTIILIHDELPRLCDEHLKCYLEILRDAAADWKVDEAHELQIFFPEKDKAEILQVFNKI